MNEQDEIREAVKRLEDQLHDAIVADMSDAQRERFHRWEWLVLCRELFCGPLKLGPIRTPEGGRDDLYDVVREAQAILSS